MHTSPLHARLGRIGGRGYLDGGITGLAEKERGLFCVEAILMGAGLVQLPPMIASLVGCGAKKPLFVIDAMQQ